MAQTHNAPITLQEYKNLDSEECVHLPLIGGFTVLVPSNAVLRAYGPPRCAALRRTVPPNTVDANIVAFETGAEWMVGSPEFSF